MFISHPIYMAYSPSQDSKVLPPMHSTFPTPHSYKASRSSENLLKNRLESLAPEGSRASLSLEDFAREHVLVAHVVAHAVAVTVRAAAAAPPRNVSPVLVCSLV